MISRDCITASEYSSGSLGDCPHISASRMLHHVNLPLPSVFFSGDNIGQKKPVTGTYFRLRGYTASVEVPPLVLDCLDRSDE